MLFYLVVVHNYHDHYSPGCQDNRPNCTKAQTILDHKDIVSLLDCMPRVHCNPLAIQGIQELRRTPLCIQLVHHRHNDHSHNDLVQSTTDHTQYQSNTPRTRTRRNCHSSRHGHMVCRTPPRPSLFRSYTFSE